LAAHYMFRLKQLTRSMMVLKNNRLLKPLMNI
jgi:hypothetical protein